MVLAEKAGKKHSDKYDLGAILLFGMCFMILQPILMRLSVSFMAEEEVLFGFYRVSLLTLAIRNVASYFVQLRIAKVNRETR